MSDYDFEEYGKTGCFHSYTYTYFRKKNSRNITLYGSKTERQGFTVFKVDMQNGKFIIKKDIEGLMLRAGEKYEVFNIAVIEKEYDAAFDEFESIFGEADELSVFSVAGRSEICGNHTDHNYGKVLAASIDLDIIAIVK